uniref:HP domain-containing protein n=1 Tax=Glossina brevipalpis TaxID=37001 RepID=A0A1A9X0G7_9MUSC
YFYREDSNFRKTKHSETHTVQTSWRPQLPLPKEISISDEHSNRIQYEVYQRQIDIVDVNQRIVDHNMMDRFYHKDKKDATSALSGSQISHASNGGNKKWSFGRLFRRKKEIESESSTEDDRKAGFSPATQKHSRVNASTTTTTTTNKAKKQKSSSRGSGKVSNGVELDRVVVDTNFSNHKQLYGHHTETEFFLPVEIMPVPKEHYYQNQQAQPQQPTQLQQQLQQQQQKQQQYLPHAIIMNQDQHHRSHMSRSANSLERRTARSTHKHRSGHKSPPISNPQANTIVCTSSEEELTSLNSGTFSKYRSDESAYSGSQAGYNNGQSRKSRAARNERYYKRLSRDSENSNGQIPVNYTNPPSSIHKWKTQPVPLSIYQASKENHVSLKALKQNFQNVTLNQHSKLRNTSSLQHMAPYVQWTHVQQQPKNLQNSVNDAKRSISYDSHIHLQKVNNKQQTKLLPPPPPPRNPTRRVNVTGHMQNASYGDLRPISYAFDQVGVPVMPANGLNGRCVSDDKIWAQASHYQSINSLNVTPVQQSVQSQKNCRFTANSEHGDQSEKTYSPNGLEFHYVADAAPRSRKPIHLLNQTGLPDETNDPPSSGILRTTKSGLPSSPSKLNASEFWKHLDKTVVQTPSPGRAGRGRHSERTTMLNDSMKPRSISSSRVTELRSYPIPTYSEVYKPKRKPQVSTAIQGTSQTSTDEVDSVICGSLFIKPSLDNIKPRVEIRNKDVNKSNSMPNHYQRRSGGDFNLTTSNNYDVYVTEKKEQQHKNPATIDAPLPSKRSVVGLSGISQINFPRKKPTNLEEAINELEAIYKSLGLTDENETKENPSTTKDFEKFALAHADEYEEEDSPTGEPDPIRDDVAYRNIKLANLQHKTVEKQPPFGIPLGPIVPAPKTDYLHVESNGDIICVKNTKTPDVVKDDLAVRTLRKEPPGTRDRFIYPMENLIKKNRATRTQSANIYSLIQRDAAKPSGGDITSLYEWTANVDRSGSMSDIHKNNSPNDIPSTLKLLQSLREQEQEVQLVKKVIIPFRHPSQGGAICQLPEVLSNPVAAKEDKSSKPIPFPRKSITPEPLSSTTSQMEEALNKIAQDAQESSIKLSQELKELRKEALITASKPKNTNTDEKNLDLELREIEKVSEAAKKCGKMLLETWPIVEEEQNHKNLHKEDKLIKAIDQVSEAAHKVCEKILNDMVVSETTKVNDKALMKSLESIQTSTIDDIAKRCMRQLKDLAEPTDYDSVRLGERTMVSTCNVETIEQNRQPLKELSNSNLTEYRGRNRVVVTKQNSVIEEIDQIMKECEDQARDQSQTNTKDQTNTGDRMNKVKKSEASSATTSSFSSSSDCLVKSSSPSASRRQSSSITSFNPYSSSDYIKSPSSDFQALSTDPIKTFSTTSYDVQTTTNSATSIVTTTTNSNVSYSPSTTPPPPPPPPLSIPIPISVPVPIPSTSNNISPNSVRTQNSHFSSPSQYNSSEELAQIFGHVEENSPRNQAYTPQSNPDASSPAVENVLSFCSSATTTTTTTTTKSFIKANVCLATTTHLTPQISYLESCHTNTNASSYHTHITKLDNVLEEVTTIIPKSGKKAENESDEEKDEKYEAEQEQERNEDEGEKQEKKEEEEKEKLSNNFNKIYASKLNIIIEKPLEADRCNHPHEHITQFESLNSLEEICSNPDSGNVSLADFPLSTLANANASLQLQSNYNTKYAISNTYITEVAIGSSSNVRLDESREKDFLRPSPISQELLISLTESKSSEKNDNELKLVQSDTDEEETQTKEIFVKHLLEESFSPNEYKHLQKEERSLLQVHEKNTCKEEEQVLEEKTVKVLEKESSGKHREKHCNESLVEIYFKGDDGISTKRERGNSVYKRKIVMNTETLNGNEDQDEDVGNDDKISSGNEQRIDLNEHHTNDNSYRATTSESSAMGQRKSSSFVYETPQIRMNLMEEKIKYEFSIPATAAAGEEENKRFEDENVEIEENVKKLQIAAKVESDHDLRLRLSQTSTIMKNDDDDYDDDDNKYDNDDEKSPNPSTSDDGVQTVVNVFGESRQMVNGLTLLEHIVVACTLGTVTNNDLLTMLLIIIGVIVIMAIGLF